MKHGSPFSAIKLNVLLVLLAIFGTADVYGQRIFNAGTLLAPQSFSTNGNAPQYITGSDLNDDGLNDLVVSNFGPRGGIGNIVVFPNVSTAGNIQFNAPVVLGPDGNPNEVAIADMDGDGKPDLIVANEIGKVSVFKNISVSGGVIAFELKFDFSSSGEVSRKISIGDLDGDNKPDIAVTNYGGLYVTGCNVTVFKNNSTAAGFVFTLVNTLRPVVNDHVHDARIGDVNNDGKPDILFIARGKLSVCLNHSDIGTSSFAIAVETPIEGTTLKLADLNKDGKLDVVAQILRGYDGIQVMKNTSTGVEHISFSNSLLPAGSGTLGLFLGDIDNDEVPDIITSRYENSDLAIIRNIAQPGGSVLDATSFNPAVRFKTNEQSILGVVLIDLDGDQKPEIIGVNKDSHNMSVFINRADITAPSAPSNVNAKPMTISNRISWDANREADIKGYKIYGGISPKANTLLGTVTAGQLTYEHLSLTTGITYYYRVTAIDEVNNESVFSNEVSATPSFGPLIDKITPESGALGSVVKISGANFSAVAAENVVYFGSVRASVISATNNEINITVPSGVSYKKIAVINKGSQLQGSSAYPYKVTFNQAQGKPFGRNSFLEDTAPQQPGSGFPSENLDIDGDGKTDLLVNATSKLEIYRNLSDAGKAIKVAKIQTITANVRDLATGDLNGDGKPDLVIADFGVGTRIFINASSPGNISFTEVAFNIPDTRLLFVKLGDMDKDGRLDLLTVSQNAVSVQIYQNLTADVNNVKFSSSSMIATTHHPNSLLVDDVDGDRKLDILCTEYGVNDKLTIFLNQCLPGEITSDRLLRNEIGVSGTYLYMDVADLDGDGKNEIIHHLGNQQVRILTNASTVGHLSFPQVHIENIPTDAHRLNFSDFDGNGKLDIIVPGSSGIYLLRNKLAGPGLQYDSPVKVADYNMALFSIADLNNDGKPDFLASDGPGIKIFRNNFDIDAPASPDNLVLTRNEGDHILTWKAVTAPDLDGYHIYAGTTPNPETLLATVTSQVTTYTHIALTAGQTYYYRIKSFDQTDNLSPYSEEVSAKVKLTPIITFAASRSAIFGDSDIDPAATSTNKSMPIRYSSSNSAIATIVNGKIHLLQAGTVNIIASQEGNQDYEQAAEVIQVLIISKADQILTFPAIPELHEGDPDYALEVVNASGLPLTFSSAAPNVVAIVNGKIHITGIGSTAIAASNPGNQNYNPVSFSQEVKVIAFPEAVISANGPLEFCAGGSVILSVDKTAKSYKWFRNGQLVTNEANAEITARIAGSYRAELQFNNGLLKSSDEVLVKIPVVNSDISASKTTIQQGESVQLRASGGIRYIWREVGGASTATADLLDVSPNQTTTYSLTAYNALGCFDTKMITITVIPLPREQVVSFSAIPDLYEGDPDYVLNVVNTTGLNLNYSSSNTSVAKAVNGILQVIGPGVATITVFNQGNQEYKPLSLTREVKILSLPLAVISAKGPLDFCAGGNVILSVNSTALSYRWFLNGSVISGETAFELKATAAGSYTAELKFNNGLVKTSGPVQIKVLTVTAAINASSIAINAGQKVRLEGQGGSRYVWNEVGKTATLSGSIIEVSPDRTTTYRLTAFNASGCFDTKEITITVASTTPDLVPNNLISVNNDGINDTWLIGNIELYPGNQVRIFDRAGRVVYSKKGYTNDWDGSYNGTPLNEDTYYYLLDPGSNKKTIKGFITLIREKK